MKEGTTELFLRGSLWKQLGKAVKIGCDDWAVPFIPAFIAFLHHVRVKVPAENTQWSLFGH